MTDLYSAILRPSGPNFEYWNQILGSHRVPLESAEVQLMPLGEEKDVEVYMLNLNTIIYLTSSANESGSQVTI